MESRQKRTDKEVASKGNRRDKIQAKNWTGRQGKEIQVPTCRTRVLAGGRCTLHGNVLAHASDRVNPDAFGDDSGQGRRAAPFRRGAGISEGGY